VLGTLADAADRALRAAELHRDLLGHVTDEDLLHDGPVVWRHGLKECLDGVGEDRRLDGSWDPVGQPRCAFVLLRPRDFARQVTPRGAQVLAPLGALMQGNDHQQRPKRVPTGQVYSSLLLRRKKLL